MTCTISIGPDNNFELCAPSGRRVYIPNSPHALQLLWQTLWYSAQPRQPAGFVNSFPTQSVINAWAKEAGAEIEEQTLKLRAERLRSRFGFDIKELDIEL